LEKPFKEEGIINFSLLVGSPSSTDDYLRATLVARPTVHWLSIYRANTRLSKQHSNLRKDWLSISRYSFHRYLIIPKD